MEMYGRRLELLNRFGERLVDGFGPSRGWSFVLAELRASLELQGVSVWSAPAGQRGLVKDAAHWRDEALAGALAAFDETLTRRAAAQGRPLFLAAGETGLASLTHGAIALPLVLAGPPRGVLNLYPASDFFLRLAAPADPGAEQFLRAIAGQLAIFMERRELEIGAAQNREIHHRVKNNLHTVASLLRMQGRRIDAQNAEQALQESINRVLSIAAVHDALSHAASGYLGLGNLVERLASALTREIDKRAHVTIEDSAPELTLTAQQASVLALIVNELLQNALKHALAGRNACAVTISIAWRDGLIQVAVQDDGPGFADSPPRFGLGLELATLLTHEELSGELRYETRDGARVTVAFAPLTRTDWVG